MSDAHFFDIHFLRAYGETPDSGGNVKKTGREKCVKNYPAGIYLQPTIAIGSRYGIAFSSGCTLNFAQSYFFMIADVQSIRNDFEGEQEYEAVFVSD